MGGNSLNLNSVSIKSSPIDFERKEVLHKNYYFDNERVERLLYEYQEGACTDVKLRDEIMEHASELIRQIIKAHNLSQICPGKDESSIGDLFQIAWTQIESVLYKYEARPHCAKCYNSLKPNDSVLSEDFIFVSELTQKIKYCPKCHTKLERSMIYYKGKSKIFNMLSQVARTVILAYIKKESRDHKNSPIFQSHLENKTVPRSHVLERFMTEAIEVCRYNVGYVKILDAIRALYQEDDKPHEGLISKLVQKSGLSRTVVTNFLKMIRLRSFEFTDSPVNEEVKDLKYKVEDQEEFQK
jgi:hypothetical protein